MTDVAWTWVCDEGLGKIVVERETEGGDCKTAAEAAVSVSLKLAQRSQPAGLSGLDLQ